MGPCTASRPFSRAQLSTAPSSAEETRGSSTKSSQPKRQYLLPHFWMYFSLMMAATRPSGRPFSSASRSRTRQCSKAGFFLGFRVFHSSRSSGGIQ